MGTITYEEIQGKDIEQCRELCNELMAFQKSQAYKDVECFDYMNFDTRMKASFEGADRAQIVVMKDDGVPVGYIFSTIDMTPEAARTYRPEWAPKGGLGFFPEWQKLDIFIGCLSNLYIREKYRGTGASKILFEKAMNWLESFDDCDVTYVYISNGNDNAYNFYMKHGFTPTHDMFDGFIKAAYKLKK